MVVREFLLIGLCLTMDAAPKNTKVDSLFNLSKKAVAKSFNINEKFVNINFDQEIDFKKFYQLFPEESNIYALTYCANGNNIIENQYNFLIKILQEFHNEPFFPYQIDNVFDPKSYQLLFNLEEAPATPISEESDIKKLAQLREIFLYEMKIIKKLENSGAIFTEISAETFMMSSKKKVIINPLSFAYLYDYKNNKECYLSEDFLLFREKKLGPIRKGGKDVSDVSYDVYRIEKEWNIFNFISSIVDYGIYSLGNQLKEEEKEQWLDCYYKLAELQEISMETGVISYDWDTIEEIISGKSKRRKSSSGTATERKPSQDRSQATTTDNISRERKSSKDRSRATTTDNTSSERESSRGRSSATTTDNANSLSKLRLTSPSNKEQLEDSKLSKSNSSKTKFGGNKPEDRKSSDYSSDENSKNPSAISTQKSNNGNKSKNSKK